MMLLPVMAVLSLRLSPPSPSRRGRQEPDAHRFSLRRLHRPHRQHRRQPHQRIATASRESASSGPGHSNGRRGHRGRPARLCGLRGGFQAGEAVLSKYSQDGRWYRATIVSVTVPEEEYVVSYTEYDGEEEPRKEHHLKSLANGTMEGVPPIGTVVKGTVKMLTNFGAFVDYGGSKFGLAHVSKIADDGMYVSHPLDVLRVGMEVSATVVGYKDEERVSLSLKNSGNNFDSARQLPIDKRRFPKRKEVGHRFLGRVVGLARIGTFVRIPEYTVDAFVPNSQINPTVKARLGMMDLVRVQVTQIDERRRRITATMKEAAAAKSPGNGRGNEEEEEEEEGGGGGGGAEGCDEVKDGKENKSGAEKDSSGDDEGINVLGLVESAPKQEAVLDDAIVNNVKPGRRSFPRGDDIGRPKRRAKVGTP